MMIWFSFNVEPTTTERPTERRTTSGEPTEHQRTTQTPQRTTQTPQRTTSPTPLTTEEDFYSHAPGGLSDDDDDSSKTPVIGGVVGAFLFICK